MKEHGKLFSTAMVRAFLEGRKNQTRRVVDAHNSLVDGSGISKKRWVAAGFDLANAWIDNGPSPAGSPGPYLKATCAEGTTHRIYSRVQPGDRIYVKESWTPGYYHNADADDGPTVGIIFRADRNEITVPAPSYELAEEWERSYDSDRPDDPKWRSSMFMPRWAARLVFDVVSVRLERLQDISAEDAINEGYPLERAKTGGKLDAFLWYRSLWKSINAPGSWQANPPVWIYDLQPVGIKPPTMPSQSAPAECTLSGGEHATD